VAGKDHFAIHTGTEDLRVQMEMFASAVIVVGAHGAGLSNLLFSDPGTALVLFPMMPHVDHTFAHLAAALDLQQYVLPEIHSNYYGHYGTLAPRLIRQTAGLVKDLLAERRAAGRLVEVAGRDRVEL